MGADTVSNDFFLARIPADRAALAVAFDRHAAGNRDAVAEVESARRLAADPDGVQEVLHVSLRRLGGAPDDLAQIRAIHFLRRVAYLRGSGNGAVGSEHVLADTQLVVAEAGEPGDQRAFGLLQGDVHGVGDLASVVPEIDSAFRGGRTGNVQVQ